MHKLYQGYLSFCTEGVFFYWDINHFRDVSKTVTWFPGQSRVSGTLWHVCLNGLVKFSIRCDNWSRSALVGWVEAVCLILYKDKYGFYKKACNAGKCVDVLKKYCKSFWVCTLIVLSFAIIKKIFLLFFCCIFTKV
jgi:hypothetical protein